MISITVLVLIISKVASNDDKNVFGESLKECCNDPITGYYRNGFCSTGETDYGKHVACATVTDEFLAHSKETGNDLSTPQPQYNFPGLKSGNCWCLCAVRWRAALEKGVAPPLNLHATHRRMLDYVSIDTLRSYSNVTQSQSTIVGFTPDGSNIGR